MVFSHFAGMILSVSTLTMGNGAAIAVSVVKGCMGRQFPIGSGLCLFMPAYVTNIQTPTRGASRQARGCAVCGSPGCSRAGFTIVEPPPRAWPDVPGFDGGAPRLYLQARYRGQRSRRERFPRLLPGLLQLHRAPLVVGTDLGDAPLDLFLVGIGLRRLL